MRCYEEQTLCVFFYHLFYFVLDALLPARRRSHRSGDTNKGPSPPPPQPGLVHMPCVFIARWAKPYLGSSTFIEILFLLTALCTRKVYRTAY